MQKTLKNPTSDPSILSAHAGIIIFTALIFKIFKRLPTGGCLPDLVYDRRRQAATHRRPLILNSTSELGILSEKSPLEFGQFWKHLGSFSCSSFVLSLCFLLTSCIFGHFGWQNGANSHPDGPRWPQDCQNGAQPRFSLISC